MVVVVGGWGGRTARDTHAAVPGAGTHDPWWMRDIVHSFVQGLRYSRLEWWDGYSTDP